MAQRVVDAYPPEFVAGWYRTGRRPAGGGVEVSCGAEAMGDLPEGDESEDAADLDAGVEVVGA